MQTKLYLLYKNSLSLCLFVNMILALYTNMLLTTTFKRHADIKYDFITTLQILLNLLLFCKTAAGDESCFIPSLTTITVSQIFLDT